MPDLPLFIRAAKRTAGLADQLGAAFARQLHQVLRDTERKLPPLIQDVTAGNRTAIVKAARANQVRKDISDALRTAGYDELASQATGAPLDALAAQVLANRKLAQVSAELSRGIELRLNGLKALQYTDLLEEGQVTARALWKATIRGVFGSRDVNAILSDLAEVIDGAESRIRTLYDTSLSLYGRAVEALQAGDDPDTKFLYFGPDDDKTRPFCLEHVGKVYTRAEIDQLDNGQLNDVFLTGGGYNCRHVWQEISKFSELYDLPTGERVPGLPEAA